jgi:DHA1 family tetracycline resistance protein-like MFS transporter
MPGFDGAQMDRTALVKSTRSTGGPAGLDPVNSEGSGSKLAIGILFATILIDFLGYSILIPVLPHFVSSFGVGASGIGLITALYAVGLVLFLPLWGWISDRIGRRPVLLVSLLGTAASFLVLAFAGSLTTVLVARFMGGFFGASIGTAQAAMTDLTDEGSRAQGMGVIGAASGIGLVVGTALGGVLGGIDPTLPFYATAAIAGLNFLLAAWALPESKQPVASESSGRDFVRALVPAPVWVFASVHSGAQRLYLFLFLQLFFAFSVIESMFPLFATARFGWGELQVGLFMASIALVLGAMQGLAVGALTRRFGEPAMTAFGFALTGVAFAGLGLSHSFPLLCVSAVCVAIGSGVAFPAFTSLFSKASGAHEQGAALSRSQAMIHTGRALGAYSWGVVFESSGASTPFLFAGAVLLAALVLFLATARVLLPPP